MKKKKLQKTNAIRLVEQHRILYKEHEFPWSEDHLGATDVAQLMGMDSDKVFKTLVTKGNKTGIVVAVIPGNKELNVKVLAKVSKNKKIEMLPLKNLEETTGYIRGGCSPIGMKKMFPTFIDQSALEQATIVVSAGKRGRQLELSPKDLAKISKAEFALLTSEME